ncbi:MAG TPA: hypothetical protein VGK01_00655, partial [Candidatus Angelobacter sp.]
YYRGHGGTQRNDKNDDGRRESVCYSRSWVSYLGLNPLEQSSRKSRRLIDQQPRQSVFKISPGGRSSNYIRGDKVEQQKVIEARLQY